MSIRTPEIDSITKPTFRKIEDHKLQKENYEFSSRVYEITCFACVAIFCLSLIIESIPTFVIASSVSIFIISIALIYDDKNKSPVDSDFDLRRLHNNDLAARIQNKASNLTPEETIKMRKILDGLNAAKERSEKTLKGTADNVLPAIMLGISLATGAMSYYAWSINQLDSFFYAFSAVSAINFIGFASSQPCKTAISNFLDVVDEISDALDRESFQEISYRKSPLPQDHYYATPNFNSFFS